jgi:surface-anchored protein
MHKYWTINILACVMLSGLARAQTILDEGHIDIEVEFENGALELKLKNHDTGEGFDPATSILYVGPLARTNRPGGSQWDFIGAPSGAPIWVLPQIETDGLLLLGFGAEEVDPGKFTGDFGVRIRSFRGPGNLSNWIVDPNGNPEPGFATFDGAEGDRSLFEPGDHLEFAWGFTEDGLYTVGLQAFGTLADGTLVESEVVDYTFGVEAVPEPATIGALGVGLAVLARRRRK